MAAPLGWSTRGSPRVAQEPALNWLALRTTLAKDLKKSAGEAPGRVATPVVLGVLEGLGVEEVGSLSWYCLLPEQSAVAHGGGV